MSGWRTFSAKPKSASSHPRTTPADSAEDHMTDPPLDPSELHDPRDLDSHDSDSAAGEVDLGFAPLGLDDPGDSS